MKSTLDDFQCHILCELDFHFNIFAVSGTRIYNDILDFNPKIPNYNFRFVPTPLSAGGVGMYIDEIMNYTVVERMRRFRLCGLNCNLQSKVILSVVSYIGNIISWIISRTILKKLLIAIALQEN